VCIDIDCNGVVFNHYNSNNGVHCKEVSSLGMLFQVFYWAQLFVVCVVIGVAVGVPHGVDFTPFHAMLRTVVDKPYDSSTHAIRPNSTSFDCVYPPKSVVFTYSTHYTQELILLQHRALDTSNLRICLEEIFVTLCLDKKCYEYCAQHNISNVALIEISGSNAELPPSDFNQGEYRYLTYLKQDLFREALTVADQFFFMDVDCLLFKNPFVEIQYGRDEYGARITSSNSLLHDYSSPSTLATVVAPTPQTRGYHHLLHSKKFRDLHNIPEEYGYDMMYQRDRGRTLDCSGSVNTGQVYMKNSSKVHHYFETFAKLKSKIMAGTIGPEQDHVFTATQSGNMSICSLTPQLFTAHCYQVFGNIRFIAQGATPVKDIITYHVSCVEGLKTKIHQLNIVLKAVQSGSRNPIKDFL
jgi:hypothetical protein